MDYERTAIYVILISLCLAFWFTVGLIINAVI